MTSNQTANAMFVTLTGFDELAIVKHFGIPIHQLHPDNGGSPFIFLRALAFIDLRRSDQKDADAYRAAMDLTIDAANNYFTDPDPADLDPDDPDTDLGKDDAPTG